MYRSVDYDNILIESLIEEFRWYEEEFECIFPDKKKFTVEDLNLANLILEKLAKILNICYSEQLLESLANTISNIKRKYPDFF